jgi:hypothetical protein
MDTELEDQEYKALQRRTKAEKLLWHYTDWSGLRGIVDSRQVWATHYTYLNDTGELIRALTITKDMFSRDLAYLQTAIDAVAAGDENETPQLFIASFSEAFDSLEQWRAYSGGSIGFALAFDAKQLREVAESYNFSLVPCKYNDQEARARAKQFDDDWQLALEEIQRYRADPQYSDTDKRMRVKSWSAEYRTVRGKLAAAMVPFKDECFKREEEVRLVSLALVRGTDYRRMHPDIVEDFRLQGTAIIRFVKVPLYFPQGQSCATADPEMKTPLRAIMFGPAKEDSAAREKLRNYARQVTGLPIVVTASRRPIRSK